MNECVTVDVINNKVFGESKCIEKHHTGLFNIKYWLTEDGIVIKIEQQMNDDYELIMEISSVS